MNSRNFGDAVNRRFFQMLTNKKIKGVSVGAKQPHYLTTGSIFKLCNSHSIILGTGFISENDDVGRGNWSKPYTNKIYSKPKQILSVRGPKTRAKLIKMGIDCPENYGDPLILFPLVCNPKLNVKKGKIGIIPHYVDKKTAKLQQLVKMLKDSGNDVEVINILVGSNYGNFMNSIQSCEYIISSSLHGVIMGVVYGKKTIFTEFSNKVVGNRFKFYDFFQSLGINYDVPIHNDKQILSKCIPLKKNNLINLGVNMLNTYPFLENARRNLLIENWKSHVGSFK